MPKKMGYSHTGGNAGQHKGGRGDYKGLTKPSYPKGPERIAKTVSSPSYPRSNFKGGSRKSSY